MIDWKRELTIATYVKSKLFEADEEGLWPQSWPEVAAREEDILAAEATLRHRLDEQYRSFLAHANGWQGVLQTIDLFGTADLAGSPSMVSASAFLADSWACLAALHCPLESFLPIAYSEESSDLFLLGRPNSPTPGRIWWISAQLIDTYPSFLDFFLAMVDYNRHLLADLKQRRQ
jgi:hypothetical protein